MRRVVTACIAASLLAAAQPAVIPASAGESCPKTTLTDIEDEVMCPVCGTPLALAENAPQAKRERAFIVSQIEKCRTKGQIKKALVAQFGPEVLAMPEKRGFDIAAWMVPALVLFFAAAGIGVALFLWLRSPAGSEPAPDTTQLTEADSKRVDDEILRLDP